MSDRRYEQICLKLKAREKGKYDWHEYGTPAVGKVVAAEAEEARLAIEDLEFRSHLTEEDYAFLIVLANKSPKELRDRVYSHVNDSLSQLQKWSRGTLIARAFDIYLQGKE